MVRRHRLCRPTRLLPMILLVGGQLAVIGVTPSAAAKPSFESGAVGGAASLAPKGGASVDSGPLASLEVAASPDGRKATLPSAAVVHPSAGSVVSTGAVTVTASSSESTASSAAAAETVDVLAGLLTADRVASSCEAGASTATRTATVAGGRLQVSSKEAVPLPDSPAPETAFKAHSDALDSDIIVVLNHQAATSGVSEVSAIRITVDGPGATGEIVLGRSMCGAPDPTTSETPSTSPPATNMPAAASAAAPGGDTTSGAAAADAPTEAAAPSQLGTRNAAAAAVTEFTGSSFNYYTDVSLFGGPSMRRGFGQQTCTGNNVPAGCAPATSTSPSATCPAGGGPASNSDNDGASAQYGPAVIFGGIWPDAIAAAPPSGPLKSSVDCKAGDGGYAKSSTDLTLMPAGSAYPGGAGPSPFIADEVHSTCSATETGTTGTTTIVNGKVETKFNAQTQEPITTVPVAANPPKNTEISGTIDHVGDSFKVVLNEQSTSSDGVLTVTAMHMLLLGPTAKGDMYIGQSVCGVRAAAGATSSTTPGATSSSTTAGTSATGGTTAGASGASGGTNGTASSGTSGSAGSGTQVAGTSTTAGSGTARSGSGSAGSGNALAHTGGTQHLVVVMLLAAAAVVGSRRARTRPKPEPSGTG